MTDEPATDPLKWYDRYPLSGTDLTDFLALRRVCGRPDSHLDQVADQYVENGRPVLPFIADGLTALLESGHVVLGEPDPASGGGRPVMVTAAGRDRYEQLCDKQGIPPYPAGLSGPVTEAPTQWVYTDDAFAHLLADPAAFPLGALLTWCGRALPAETTATFSVPPSLDLCPLCRPPGRVAPPPVTFPAPIHY